MIICHCHRVSDREVREAYASGAGRVRAVASCTRAGTQCGGCVNHLREVLAASADGATVADVAGRLHLSESTVRNYLSSAIGKTGSRNRIEALRAARDNGWL